MKRTLLGTLAAAAVCASVLTSAATPSNEQQWTHDRETILHARLAGMKAGLELRSDQEPLWSGFQSAVEDIFKSHTESGEPASPVDRLARGSDEGKKIAEAARPLYDSLDDTQKHSFELLGRDAMPRRPSVVGYYPPGGSAGFSWVPPGWDD